MNCGSEGDAAGWAVATDGDFDGDGIHDVAVGAPCSRVAGESNVGRVFIHSGATGRRILTLKGSLKNQKFGGALAFTSDVSGDGLEDLVVGSPGWTTGFGLPQAKSAAGKVSVFSLEGVSVFDVEGTFGNGNLGEAVAAILDGDGDGIADIAVGAGGDRDVAGGDRFGAVYLISGATGQQLDAVLGEIRFDQWGAVVSTAGDVDGDSFEDVLVSSNLADLLPDGASQSQENNGLVRILSGADLANVIAEARGAPEDKLGKSSAMAGDFDRDGVLDFVAGAPGVTVGNKGNAGEISIFSGLNGAHLKTITEPSPQAGAAFGSAVAGVGRIDSDKVPDVVASSPAAQINGFADVGRVHMFSANGGGALWSLEGVFPGSRVGHSLASIPDLDYDGFTDVAVGSPGDAFRGKRGAGTVRLLSGKTGATLQTFGGRVGIETRIFTAGWTITGDAQVRSVTSVGRTTRGRQDVLRGVRDGAFSLAIVDESGDDDVKLAVAAGRGASEPWVEVKRARRRRGQLSRFRAEFSGPYSGGVNVAAGKLTADPGEELAVVQAESATGDVELSIYARVDTDPFGRITWGRKSTFPVFSATDVVDGFVVNADGASIAVGAISTGDDRIVVGSGEGTPVVRVFDALGQMEAQWLLYPVVSATGVAVAIGNIDSGGSKEIVTVPRSGQLRVRAFNPNGTPFLSPDTGSVVDFVVPSSVVGFSTSFQVAVADVDLDNRGEILIVPESGVPCHIVAFEVDGSLVAQWPQTVFPFWPVSAGRIALAATDRFLTRR